MYKIEFWTQEQMRTFVGNWFSMRVEENLRKKSSFQWWHRDNGASSCTGPHLTHYTRIQSKWVQDSNTRAETIKLLGKKKTVINLWTLDEVMAYDASSAWNQRGEKRWIRQSKSKTFMLQATPGKGTHTEWEETFANHTSDTDLVPTLYKQLL